MSRIPFPLSDDVTGDLVEIPVMSPDLSEMTLHWRSVSPAAGLSPSLLQRSALFKLRRPSLQSSVFLRVFSFQASSLRVVSSSFFFSSELSFFKLHSSLRVVSLQASFFLRVFSLQASFFPLFSQNERFFYSVRRSPVPGPQSLVCNPKNRFHPP